MLPAGKRENCYKYGPIKIPARFPFLPQNHPQQAHTWCGCLRPTPALSRLPSRSPLVSSLRGSALRSWMSSTQRATLCSYAVRPAFKFPEIPRRGVYKVGGIHIRETECFKRNIFRRVFFLSKNQQHHYSYHMTPATPSTATAQGWSGCSGWGL